MKLQIHYLKPGGRSSRYFDLLRGIAAVYVMVFHFREQLFVGASNLAHPSFLTKVLYLATSIGYQFVMAFFVLSGFLISTSVIKQITSGKWSWRTYLTNRIVRLWLVLIPALLLTFGWDKLAILITGDLKFYNSTLNWHDFFGNLFFTQGIFASTYGQNIPLWSLSYEFWYYILFPCIVLAIVSRRWWTRIAYGIVSFILMVFIGKTILAYFLVWLLGLAVAICPGLKVQKGISKLLMTSGAIAVTTIVMVGEKILQLRLGVGEGNMFRSFPESLGTGVAFAILLYVLLQLFNEKPVLHGKSANSFPESLSGMSYSLYLTHCPVILALRVMIGYETWKPGLLTSLIAIVVCLGIMVYAWFVSRITEYHTRQVRNWVLTKIIAPKKRDMSVTI